MASGGRVSIDINRDDNKICVMVVDVVDGFVKFVMGVMDESVKYVIGVLVRYPQAGQGECRRSGWGST